MKLNLRNFLSLLAILIAFDKEALASENSYVILTANKWFYGYNQTILFDFSKNNVNTNLNINLVNGIDSIQSFDYSASVDANDVTLVSFKLPESLRSGNYNLTITGSGPNGYQFVESTQDVVYTKETSSYYIITDKSTYRPSETVLIRVVGLDANALPSTGSGASVYIYDPQQNLIGQFLDLTTSNGLLDDLEFQLSSQAFLGAWQIRLIADNASPQTIQFNVEEYVLPNLEISAVISQDYLNRNSSNVAGVFNALYTYGQGADGNLTIEVKENSNYYYYNYKFVRPVPSFSNESLYSYQKSYKVSNGKLSFNIPIKLTSQSSSLTINFTFFDQYSGESQNTVNTLSIYDVLINVASNQVDFVAGKINKFSLTVQDPVGKPFPNRLVNVNVTQTLNYYEHSPVSSQKLTTDSSGSINLTVNANENATQILIQVSFEDGQSAYVYLYKRYIPIDLPSTDLIIINTNSSYDIGSIGSVLISKNLDLNGATDLSVNGYYFIVARSVVVKYGEFSLDNGPFNLRILFSSAYAPNSNLFVYYSYNSSFFVKNVQLNLNGLSENSLKFNFGQQIVAPGDLVNLSISSQPNSLVSICVVDQRTILKSTPNSLTSDLISNQLQSFQSNYYYSSKAYETTYYQTDKTGETFYSYWQIAQAITDFNNGGLIAFSDFESLQPKQINESYVYNYYLEDGPIYEFAPNMEAQATTTAAFSFKKNQDSSTSTNTESSNDVIRENFAETWIWSRVNTGNDGQVNISSKIPDSITSWIASGFSLNKNLGVGIADNAKITSFLPFFVSSYLPAYLIRGESLVLRTTVFNYLSVDLNNVVVTFKKTNDFKQVTLSNGNQIESNINKDLTQTISVLRSQTGQTVEFIIKAVNLGMVPITITARSNISFDGEKRVINAKAEGIKQDVAISSLIDLRAKRASEQKITISIPAGIVPNSEICGVQLIGDILGSAFDNLNDLLTIPSGCGEQNMITLTPNIYAIDYINVKSQYSSSSITNLKSLNQTANDNIRTGYQNELNYRRQDGSFSAFGNSDDNGSSWLTSFVVKSFSQAKKYAAIDANVISSAVYWVLSQQAKNGSFNEPGRVIHTDMQGGVNSRLTLTAYIAAALIESNIDNNDSNVTDSISRAVKYIESQLSQVNDVYTSTIVTYALQLAQSAQLDAALTKFNSYANRSLSGQIYWSKNEPVVVNDYFLIRETPSSDIEMTAYGLLIYLARNKTSDAFAIVKWLVSKSNSLGTYSSTQNTIVSLQALSRFAAQQLSSSSQASSLNLNVSVTLNYLPPNKPTTKSFSINNRNSLLLQSWQFTSCPPSITIRSSGSGIGLLQSLISYNVPKPDISTNSRSIQTVAKNLFISQIVSNLTSNVYSLLTCAKYTQLSKDGKTYLKTGMAVIESEILSGFTVDQQKLDALISQDKKKNLKLVEFLKSDNKVAFYLNSLTNSKYCIKWQISRTFDVADPKPVSVVVYDYYSPQIRATTQYGAPSNQTKLCQINSNRKGCKKTTKQ